MAKYIFGRRFHDLKYLEDEFFFIILQTTKNLMAQLQKFEEI